MPIHDWSRVDAMIFHDLHVTWIGLLKSRMNAGLLPAPFYALAEPALGDIAPDILRLRTGTEGAGSERGVPGAEREEGPSAPVAGAPAGVLVQELAPPDAYAARARRIVIKDESHDDEVVAVIELVSRGNKTSRRDRDQFVEKATSLLRSGVHVVVVDLHPATAVVPGGFHALLCADRGEASPERPATRPLEAVSYEVLDTGAVRSHVVPLACGDALPEMPVFLRPHWFVRLPMERTYMEAFQGLPERFRRVLDAHS